MAGLYDYRWQKARVAFLNANPLCAMCERRGRVTVATVVDHVIPHRGDRRIFWDRENWQPLCASCHDGAKQAEERSGVVRGADTDGVPIDPGHHWNEG